MAGPQPLRRFVLFHIATATMLPVIIIAILIWWFMMPQMRASIGIQQQSLARAVAGEIWAHLMGGERQLFALADAVVAEEGYSASQLTALLDAGCGEGDLFETIYVVGEENKVITNIGLARPSRTSRDDLLGIDVSGRDIFKTARQEVKTIWSETFLSTVSSRLAVAVAIPLPGRVLAGEITLTQLSKFTSQLPVETGLITLVLDRQGRIVADSQQKRWGQQLELATLPSSGSGQSIASASQPFYLDSVHLVGSMVDVERLGWKVLVAQPYLTAFKPLRAVFIMIAAGLVFAMMVALALAWIQAKRLGRLVEFYTDHAKSLAQGKYDLHWPPAKTLEYRELGQSLQSMAQKIRQREQELVASETHMRITLDSIGDAVIATDTDGTITRLNPMAEMLTGWPSAEATGHPLLDVFNIVNSGTRQPVPNPVDRVLSTGKIVGLASHTLLIARDGCEYQIADSGAPILHTDGQIAGVVLVFRDITERYAQEQKILENEAYLRREVAQRKRIEKELRQSEERLDLALSGANEGIWDWDIENGRLHFDARYYSICGYEPNEFPAAFDEWEKRIHPDDLQPVKSSISQYLAGDLDSYDVEFRFLRKDGDYMWIQGKGKIVARNEQGNPRRLIGTHSDITERKRLEASLYITQFSFDNASVGIYRIAEDTRILDVNAAAAEMLGYTMEEMATMSIFDIDPVIKPVDRDEMWKAVSEQGGDHFETVHRRKDGSEIPVEIHSNLLEYDGQQYSIAFAQDITRRKQADRDIRGLRNYLSNIINSMPSVLIGVDCEGRVTQWNTQAEVTTGLAFAEAKSQRLETVFPRLKNKMKRIEKAIEERRVLKELKVPHRHQNGTQYEDVTIFPLVANGVEGAVIRVDDVTERVHLEESMIQNEKMLSIGGLAAGMAHEINNPLAGILQNTAVLSNRLLKDLPANQKAADTAGITMAAMQHYLELRKLPEMIENIHSSGLRATAIVKNMLGFARKSDHIVSCHDLGALLDQTLELVQADFDMKRRYDFKKIQIVKAYEAAGTRVPCDAGKIQQVFMNLLKNGAEAMAGVGATTMAEAGRRPPRFILRTKVDGDWVQVDIEDNGPGMNAKTRTSVFEPFFTTKPLGKGTGLGLSVSYFIVTENHGGQMEVHAADIGGTRFVIRLPKRRKPEPFDP